MQAVLFNWGFSVRNRLSPFFPFISAKWLRSKTRAEWKPASTLFSPIRFKSSRCVSSKASSQMFHNANKEFSADEFSMKISVSLVIEFICGVKGSPNRGSSTLPNICFGAKTIFLFSSLSFGIRFWSSGSRL